MIELEGHSRFDIVNLMSKEQGAVGVELGVAAGGFSKRMVETGRFAQFFGVDVYGDNHDTAQYKQALRACGLFGPYKLLRMTFDEALDLFDDDSLDFIYIDGFAATGQEGGQTIYDWAKKVRVGGVIAGDDYHSDWPLVQKAVDRFAQDTGFELHVTTIVEPDSRYNDYPSWGVIKADAFDGTAPETLVAEGKAASRKLSRKRATEQRFARGLKSLLGGERYNRLREWNRRRKSRR